MSGLLEIVVSKVGLRVYPEVYVAAIDVTGAMRHGDLVPYDELTYFPLDVGWYTIRARNDVTGEIIEKDVEIFEGVTTPIDFIFGIIPTEVSALPSILGALITGLALMIIGVG